MSANDALNAFNHAVSDWSGQFAPELQRVTRIIGNRVGWDHNEFTISWSSLQRHYRAAYGETISLPTLKKYARLWADQGGLKIIPRFHETNGPQLNKHNPGRLGKDGKRVGTRGGRRFATDASNTFVVYFDTVVKGRKIRSGVRGRRAAEYWTEPWTFGQAGITLPLSSPSVAGQLPCTTFNSVNTPVSTTCNPRGNPSSNMEVEVRRIPSGESPAEQRAWIESLRSGKQAAQSPAQPGSRRTWDKNPGDRNTVTFWQTSGHGRVIPKGNVWTHDKPRPKRVPGVARTVVLTEDEASWMWHRWPKGRPPEQIDFLRMLPSHRARMIEHSDKSEEAEDARKAAVRAARPSAHQLVVTAYRDHLIYLGVAADEIDKKITGEWGGLKPYEVQTELRSWIRAADPQAGNRA